MECCVCMNSHRPATLSASDTTSCWKMASVTRTMTLVFTCFYIIFHYVIAGGNQNMMDNKIMHPLGLRSELELVTWTRMIGPEGGTWTLNKDADVPVQLTFPPNAVNQNVIFNCNIGNRRGHLPRLEVHVTYDTGTEVEEFQDYIELRFTNVSSSLDEQIHINGYLMPRKGTCDKVLREGNSILVLWTEQFLFNQIICRNITDVFLRVYERDSSGGIDVKLYLSTNEHNLSCPIDDLSYSYHEYFRIQDKPYYLDDNMTIHFQVSDINFSWSSDFQLSSILVESGLQCECICCDPLPEAAYIHFHRDTISFNTILAFDLSVRFDIQTSTIKHVLLEKNVGWEPILLTVLVTLIAVGAVFAVSVFFWRRRQKKKEKQNQHQSDDTGQSRTNNAGTNVGSDNGSTSQTNGERLEIEASDIDSNEQGELNH